MYLILINLTLRISSFRIKIRDIESCSNRYSLEKSYNWTNFHYLFLVLIVIFQEELRDSSFKFIGKRLIYLRNILCSKGV